MTTPNDPAAFFANLLGQWQSFSKDSESQGAGFRQFAERAMAAANVPGRSDIEELSARLVRVEAALFRIEAMLGKALATREPLPEDRPSPE